MNRAERGHKKEGDREEDGRRGRQMIEIAQGKHGGEGNTMRDGKTRGGERVWERERWERATQEWRGVFVLSTSA